MWWNAAEKKLTIGEVQMDYITFGNGPRNLIMIQGLNTKGIKGAAFSLAYLYRIFAEMQNINYSKSDQCKLIEPALDVINKEFFKSNLNSPYLAELCGISESYLKKIFNKKYGMPPKKYIIKKKMDYACELLRLERYSITQISEICNFKDVYYFSRQFKEYMGISPMDYVKRSKSRH